jgi:AcrR family transcriptional regulator
VTFGVASIGRLTEQLAAAPTVPVSCPHRGGGAVIYDCGSHGWLTVAQIAAIAGTSKVAIYKRLKANARGEELCQRRWANQSNIRKASPPRRHMLVLAFQLAERFPDRIPSPGELMQLRPMSLANANHWRQAIATARAEIHAKPQPATPSMENLTDG